MYGMLNRFPMYGSEKKIPKESLVKSRSHVVTRPTGALRPVQLPVYTSENAGNLNLSSSQCTQQLERAEMANEVQAGNLDLSLGRCVRQEVAVNGEYGESKSCPATTIRQVLHRLQSFGHLQTIGGNPPFTQSVNPEGTCQRY